MAGLTGSVGMWEAGAKNVPTDVTRVQELLTAAARQLNDPSLDPKGVDGKIGKPPLSSNTVNAILAFQQKVVRMPAPDGRVDPNGQTWQALQRFAAAQTPDAGAGGEYFPFSTLTTYSWATGMRRFGANRGGGSRAHAGCDLYYSKGTTIHAVKDGTVIRGPYYFYSQTYALEVDHGTFVVRYGEVQSTALVAAGSKVTAGQAIAKVGHLVGITVPSDMLHFEMYSKTASGALTITGAASAKRSDGVPYQRRKDLMDPTPFLNRWKGRLAPA